MPWASKPILAIPGMPRNRSAVAPSDQSSELISYRKTPRAGLPSRTDSKRPVSLNRRGNFRCASQSLVGHQAVDLMGPIVVDQQ